jgi:hypothetical protein
MSPEMYADILSSVLNDWVDELSGEALIDFAQVCRAQMFESASDTAAVALAAELSYDRALLKVCEAHGIGTSTRRFTRPREERSRLEGELVRIGVDLVSSPGTGPDT